MSTTKGTLDGLPKETSTLSEKEKDEHDEDKGPAAGFFDYEAPDNEPTTMAPGPLGPQFDTATTLTSAGDSFTKGLAPSHFGTVA